MNSTLTCADTIETLGRSQIQHGPSNDRVYIMKIEPSDVDRVIARCEDLVANRGYSKVFGIIPSSLRDRFLHWSPSLDCVVPGLFNGTEDGLFLEWFVKPERGEEGRKEEVEKIIGAARSRSKTLKELDPRFILRPLEKRDLSTAADLYGRVFPSYPFPIDDSAYLTETLGQGVLYWGVFDEGNLVGCSSAETKPDILAVEMTDFAVLPEYRGYSLARHLLRAMEEEIVRRGYRTSYTIARALSFGMNITFSSEGYRFAGTLTNNTQIFAELQSMNIWYKGVS